jgi:branched-chain amino acid transport system permease protein
LHGLGVVGAFACGTIAAAAAGLFLSVVTLRLNHLFLALATLIFGEIVTILATNSNQLGGAAGLAGLPLLTLWPTVLTAAVVILALELVVIRGSRLEVLSRVLAHDAALVEMSGRSSQRLRVGVFSVSAAVAGFAGCVSVFNIGVVQPSDLSFHHSLNILVYAIVGGSASGLGALVGGFALTVVPIAANLDGIESSLLLGAILLGVMLVRRDGLISRMPVGFLPPRQAIQRSPGPVMAPPEDEGESHPTHTTMVEEPMVSNRRKETS